MEPEAYDFYNEVFGFIEEREGFCMRAESVPYIAVLIPNDTVDTTPALLGAHKALVEKHLQYDLIDEYQFPNLRSIARL